MNLQKTFSGLKDAKVTKKGVFLTEGQYLLKIKNTIVIQPMSGPEAFILESEIVETSDPENHPVGTERTWYQSFKYRDSALGELKKFTYAVLKLDTSSPAHRAKIEKEVDPQIETLLAEAVDKNRFAGQTVRCEVVERPTKTEGGVYSQYNFSPSA